MDREKLLLEVVKASVAKNGVDVRANDMHADAIIDLVNKLIEKEAAKEK